MELLIAILLFSVIVLGLSNIDIFSRLHVMSSSRQAQLQGELSNALEHMSKRVIQGVGRGSSPPIEPLPLANGFRVRLDPNHTLPDLTDDLWFNYVLNGNTLSCTCTTASATPCPPAEVLSTHIMAGVVFGIMTAPLPAVPSGYYINLTDNNSIIEVGLVTRFSPNTNSGPANPEVAMKFRMQTRLAAGR